MKITNENWELWLKYNAKLQAKKNKLRTILKDKGVLKRGAVNNYDKYSYFSEAQYKELFTGLFAECGLELSSNVDDYTCITGTEKQQFGRLTKVTFTLTDVETGFAEQSTVTGEGMDKGDKAGYKAYTGAVKYYLANTFLVATGDDPEKDEKDETPAPKPTQKPVPRSRIVDAPVERKMSAEEAKAYVIPYGSHKGELLTEVYKTDREYIPVLYNAAKGKKDTKTTGAIDALETLIKNAK